MIDLHNHLLPELDDGAQTLDEALALAQIAVADGITHAVCTPHIRPGLYDNTVSNIDTALEQYEQALSSAGIPLKVAAAAEIHFTSELMPQAESKSIPLLGKWQGKNVFLLEFPNAQIPFGASKLVDWLSERDLLPMIAHPERNQQVIAQPQCLDSFLEAGCLLQITGGALTGHFGMATQHCAEQLLLADAVTCIATDSHNADTRPPILSRGTAAAAALVGAAKAEQLSKTNPWLITKHRFGNS